METNRLSKLLQITNNVDTWVESALNGPAEGSRNGIARVQALSLLRGAQIFKKNLGATSKF
jgi:hypothetical protein